MTGHLVELGDETYSALQALKEVFRVVAEGKRVTDEMVIAEAISNTIEMTKQKDYLQALTKEMVDRTMDFQEDNK